MAAVPRLGAAAFFMRGLGGMASNNESAPVLDFHKTRTYKEMGSDLRRALARYKRETGAGDGYVAYQMRLEDLKHIDEATKKQAQSAGSWMLIIALMMDLVAVNSMQPIAVFLCTGVLLVLGIMWVSGRFNGIEAEKRGIRKRMRGEDAPTFADWLKKEEPELAEKFSPKPKKSDDEDDD